MVYASNKNNSSLLKLGGSIVFWSLKSVEETNKMQLISSRFSLASSRVTRIQSPHFRTTFYLRNTPTRFNGIAHSVVAGALRALPSVLWLGGGTGRKEKWGILLFSKIISGKLLLHPALLASLIRKGKSLNASVAWHLPRDSSQGVCFAKAPKEMDHS